MTRATQKNLSRLSLALAVIPVLFVVGIFWSDRFVAFDDSRTLSVRQALDAGLLQGFLLLNGVLLGGAVALYFRRSWARWLVLGWLPLLALHNLCMEWWQSGAASVGSTMQAAMISALWLWALFPFLAGRDAAELFRRNEG